MIILVLLNLVYCRALTWTIKPRMINSFLQQITVKLNSCKAFTPHNIQLPSMWKGCLIILRAENCHSILTAKTLINVRTYIV